MFRELIEARDKAEKEWYEISKTVDPYRDKYMKAESAIEKAFIEQKLYIPIDKLKDYLKEENAIRLTIVYENGETEELYHNYEISFYPRFNDSQKNYNFLESGTDDDGYYFKYDIKKEHIVGFYDLKLNSGDVKETLMEEIVKNLD